VLTEAASLLREHYEDTLSVPKLFPDRNAVNAVSAGVATGSGTSRGKRKAKRRKYDDDDEYVDDDDDSEFVEEESGVVEMSEPTPEELRLVRIIVCLYACFRAHAASFYPTDDAYSSKASVEAHKRTRQPPEIHVGVCVFVSVSPSFFHWFLPFQDPLFCLNPGRCRTPLVEGSCSILPPPCPCKLPLCPA
jgi:hypothetical protein